MFPGPVCAFEVRRLPRRWQAFGVRAGYGLVLLLILAQNYYGWVAATDGELTNRQAALFALTTFASFAVYQLGAVLALTPALVAGTIADERQRKTLHYLLTSRLSGPEIVLGKLSARLLHLLVCLAVGLPVLSLLTLLGGIDPWLLATVFGATASTAYFLAAVSVLLSVHARRVRDAVFAAYALEALWLISPFVSGWLLGLLPAWAEGPLSTVVEWFDSTSPMGAVWDFFSKAFFIRAAPLLFRPGWRLSMFAGLPLTDSLLTMMGQQLAAGTAMILIAAWRLRPAFRALEAAAERPRGGRWQWQLRLLPRPACGDAPVRWKELWTERRGGLVRRVGALASLALGLGVLGLGVWYAADVVVSVSFWTKGAGWDQSMRWMNWYVMVMVSLLGVVMGLTQVAHGASSITGEREADTWTSLTATDLTAEEVVGGKVAGALWRGRGTALLVLLLLALGLATRTVEPWGAVAALASLEVFATFAAVLGVTLSLCLPASHRAQVFGVGVLFLLNVVGQAVVGLVSAIVAPRSMVPMLFPGCQPAVVGWMVLYQGPFWSLVRGQDLDYLSLSSSWGHSPGEQMTSAVLTILAYAAASYGLWRLALRRFDAVAGRPREGGDRPSRLTRALLGVGQI
jgi:ABC-type transport system involved in multi-copper enzyme maturation permease subunit